MKNDEIGLSYYSYGPRISLQKAISAKRPHQPELRL